MATEYRAQGFAYIDQSFDSYPSSPDIYEEVVLNRLKIVIVGSREYFNWTKARQEDSRIKGYATRENEIFIFGKRLGNKIVVNQAILGHELHHILNFNNPIFANPHALENLELSVFGSGEGGSQKYELNSKIK